MKKSLRLMSIVLVLLLLSGCHYQITLPGAQNRGTDPSGQTQEAKLQEFKMQDMTFRAPAFMEYEKEQGPSDSPLYGQQERHTFTDSKGGYRIQFYYQEYRLLTTPEGAASTTMSEVNGQPSLEVDMYPVIINGTSWLTTSMQEEMESDTQVSRVTAYVYCDGYHRYTALFMYTNLADEVDYAEMLMPYVVMDYGRPLSAENLAGTWQDSEAGTLVMEENGAFAWYEDSSMDPNNVMTGVCQLSDKPLDKSQTPAGDSYYARLLFDKNVIDGKVSQEEYQREYFFVQQGDRLECTSINNSSVWKMTRGGSVPAPAPEASAPAPASVPQGSSSFGEDLYVPGLLHLGQGVIIDPYYLDRLNDNGTMKLEMTTIGNDTAGTWDIDFVADEAYLNQESSLLSSFAQNLQAELEAQGYQYKQGSAGFDTFWTKADHQFVVDDHSDQGYVTLHFNMGWYME